MQGGKAALIEPGMPALQSLTFLCLGRGVDIGHVQGLQRMVQQQLADQVIDAQVSPGGARGFSEVVAGPLLARQRGKRQLRLHFAEGGGPARRGTGRRRHNLGPPG